VARDLTARLASGRVLTSGPAYRDAHGGRVGLFGLTKPFYLRTAP